jgi:hypothetical protein
MATDFPLALDDIDDAGAFLEGPPTHESLHNDLRDAIAAIQATVGTVGDSKIILRYDDEAGRDFLVPSPTDGMMVWTDSPAVLWIYKGSAWQRVDDAGTEVQSLANVETGASNVLIDSASVTIVSSTVTLPVGWNSMDIEVAGFVSAQGTTNATCAITASIAADERMVGEFSVSSTQILAVPVAAVSASPATTDVTVEVAGTKTSDNWTATRRNIYVRKTRVS